MCIWMLFVNQEGYRRLVYIRRITCKKQGSNALLQLQKEMEDSKMNGIVNKMGGYIAILLCTLLLGKRGALHE